MTDVITKPASKRPGTLPAKRPSTSLAKPGGTRAGTPVMAKACAHEVHELCLLVSCECGCHGSND